MSHHLHPEHHLLVHHRRHEELADAARQRRWARQLWQHAQAPPMRASRPPDLDDELVLAS